MRVEAAVIVVAVFVVVVCSFEYLRLPPARKNGRSHLFTRQVLLRYSSSSGLRCHLRSQCTLPRSYVRTHARTHTHTREHADSYSAAADDDDDASSSYFRLRNRAPSAGQVSPGPTW